MVREAFRSLTNHQSTGKEQLADSNSAKSGLEIAASRVKRTIISFLEYIRGSCRLQQHDTLYCICQASPLSNLGLGPRTQIAVSSDRGPAYTHMDLYTRSMVIEYTNGQLGDLSVVRWTMIG